MDIATLEAVCQRNGYFDITLEKLTEIEVPEAVWRSKTYKDFAIQNERLNRYAYYMSSAPHSHFDAYRLRAHMLARSSSKREGRVKINLNDKIKEAARVVFLKCEEHFEEIKTAIAENQDEVKIILTMIPFMVGIAIPSITAHIICTLLSLVIYAMISDMRPTN